LTELKDKDIIKIEEAKKLPEEIEVTLNFDNLKN
jgi:hypothetical protein